MHCHCKKGRADRHTDGQTNRLRQTYTHRHTQIDRDIQTDRQTDRRNEEGRQAGGQQERGKKDGWIDKWMDRNRKAGTCTRKEGEYSVSRIWLVREPSKLYLEQQTFNFLVKFSLLL